MTSARSTPATELRDNFSRVHDRMAAAAERAGRRADSVAMIAVTKYAMPDQIRQIVELGQTDLGESQVQQLVQRAASLEEFVSRKRTLGNANTRGGDQTPAQIRWHMIGHLQRNKVKQVVPVAHLIHSVDSLRLAEELHNYGARHDTVIDVLLQVNVSGEESKSGIAAPAAYHMAEQIDSMMTLKLRGLMTMAPHCDDPEETRPTFSRMRDIFEEIRDAKVGGKHFNILSMGMTNDFEVAIEEGANVVRIGRALFGDNATG